MKLTPSPLCHLDRSAHGPAAHPSGMKNRCCGLPTNLSSRPKRSEVERSAVPFQAERMCFSTERTRISYFTASSNGHVCGSPQRETHATQPITLLSTGNPGERSGEICSSDFPERSGLRLRKNTCRSLHCAPALMNKHRFGSHQAENRMPQWYTMQVPQGRPKQAHHVSGGYV
jgi:hypothetical protein